MNTFPIYIKNADSQIKLMVEKVYESSQIERYKIIGKDKTIVIQNNSPMLKGTKSKKALQWKLIEGRISKPELFVMAVREIEKAIWAENGNKQLPN